MVGRRRRDVAGGLRAASAGAAAATLAVCAALPAIAAAGCPPREATPSAPRYATDLNGVAWPDFCFEKRETAEEHFFVIGDWGGIFHGADMPPETAYDHKRGRVENVDSVAQLLVAKQMAFRANTSRPRYIINVGDNFYWGGINADCGAETNTVLDSVLPQWDAVFESIYNGPSLVGLPWLGVLGNHDYGGYMFTKGWDQAVAYTWGPSGRWLTPALYWSTKVKYSDFVVDYLFVDSNVNDAFAPQDQPSHNMCSEMNNPPSPSCGVTGPVSAWDCTMWFQRLWQEQLLWMPQRLQGSVADWRIVVTHFPPEFHREDWTDIVSKYNVDLFITGHRHQQEVHQRDFGVGGAAWIVSGGGGGIFSEGTPREDGDDDQYGFFDVTISKEQIKLEAISHSGIIRSTTIVEPHRSTTQTSTTMPATSQSEAEGGTHGRDLQEDIPYMSSARAPSGRLRSRFGLAAWIAGLCAVPFLV